MQDRRHRQVGEQVEPGVEAILGAGRRIGHREDERSRHEESEHQRPEHRMKHAARHGMLRPHRFLRRVRGGIEAGDRIDRIEQADHDRDEGGARLRHDEAARFAGVVGEGEGLRKIPAWRVGEHGEGQHDRHDEDEIAGKVRQPRRRLDAEVIEERLADRDERDHDRLHPPAAVADRRARPARHVHAEHAGENQVAEEEVDAEIDRGDDEEEAEHVEPRRNPAPAASAEDRGPMVEAAGGRIGRRDLSERRGNDHREYAADEPANRDGEGPARGKRYGEGGDAASEDADDRERDREVREAFHAPVEFLRVAHAVQDFDVLLLLLFGVTALCVAHLTFPLSSSLGSAAMAPRRSRTNVPQLCKRRTGRQCRRCVSPRLSRRCPSRTRSLRISIIAQSRPRASAWRESV